MGKIQRQHTAKTKLKAAIEMISSKSPVAELAQKYGVHPSVLQRWKTELLEGGTELFSRRKKRAESGPTVGDLQRKISHDGVGRCIDNIRMERLWLSIKYEHIHLYRHRIMWELEKGLSAYLTFYNTQRRHQGINYLRPANLHLAA